MERPAAPSVGERIAEVRERIARAAREAGRDPGAIRLIAVSKGQPAEIVLEAVAEGLGDFGENYAQELLAKERAVRERLASPTSGAASPALGAPPVASSLPIAWHYQGTIQRRKVKDLLPVVASFHSVARREEIEEIARRASLPMTCLVEVNIGSEPQKNGVLPDDLGDLLEYASSLAEVRIAGIMTVPPDDDSPARWFALLRALAERHRLREISMGMSSDYELAIREGATIVRVGTAIFGQRASRAT